MRLLPIWPWHWLPPAYLPLCSLQRFLPELLPQCGMLPLLAHFLIFFKTLLECPFLGGTPSPLYFKLLNIFFFNSIHHL